MDARDRRRIATLFGLIGIMVIGLAGRGALNAAAIGGALPPAMHLEAAAHTMDLPASVAPPDTSAAVIASAARGQDATPPATDESAVDRSAFRDAMRRVWEDHIAWTRLYIVSAVADLPDREQTAQRLLRNQSDIGNAIRPFYGDAAADQLTALLSEHITDAVTLLDAAKRGDQAAFETARTEWYANADAIAAFLHTANPDRWPLASLQSEMKMHLDLTLEEATARLNGDFTADIAAYDQIQDHILRLADLLSDGIVQQFPDRFV